MGMKVSYESIRQSCLTEEVLTQKSNNPLRYVRRIFSIRLTPLFINLGFSANAVTALGSITVIFAVMFILLGAVGDYNFIIGAILLNVASTLDRIDGNIARSCKQSSKFGALFDSINGIFQNISYPICLGLALYLRSSGNQVFFLGIEVPEWFWLAVGLVCSCLNLFRKVISSSTRIILNIKTGIRPKMMKSNILFRSFEFIFSTKMELLLLAALLGGLKFFLFGYTILNLIAIPVTILFCLWKTYLVDRKNNLVISSSMLSKGEVRSEKKSQS